MTALGKKITAFEKLASKPRQNVAKKAAANKALPRLMKQGRNILKRRIDRLMVQFETSAPEFYAEYRTARKIVNAPATQSGERCAERSVEGGVTTGQVIRSSPGFTRKPELFV